MGNEEIAVEFGEGFKLHMQEKTINSTQLAPNALLDGVWVLRKHNWNDSQTVNHVSFNNYLALKEFFRLFPEYSKNEFYITGESYGGIYVPTLAERVMVDQSINFKGIAVGNGLSSWEYNDNSLVYFAYYHGLLRSTLWSDLQKFCCSEGKCNFHDNKDENCQLRVREVLYIVWSSGLNAYNLYADCIGGVPGEIRFDENQKQLVTGDLGILFPKNEMSLWWRKKLQETQQSHRNMRLDPPCTNTTAPRNFLNDPRVRKALHIPVFVQKWEMCSATVNLLYRPLYSDMKNQYLKLLAARVTVNRRTWLYNDGNGDQVGGFVKEFGNLALLTIKGAGHMVPIDKPEASFTFFSRFLLKQPY
ncbi:hypothetical protein scyTo_0020136 [Scyliorhinus torazame]|uniref:Carboxypeptidase n=1 Tax=Scyliorhinus torazame TaxID=75743 RepID=A0A401Q002_SCYTO|nr:hypothetical protein [Scyliorhinus torazame]